MNCHLCGKPIEDLGPFAPSRSAHPECAQEEGRRATEQRIESDLAREVRAKEAERRTTIEVARRHEREAVVGHLRALADAERAAAKREPHAGTLEARVQRAAAFDFAAEQIEAGAHTEVGRE